MIVVIDTNTLLQCYTQSSRHYPIWEALIVGKFSIVISSDIMFEYEEVLNRKVSSFISNIIIETLLEGSNVILKQPFFHWNAIAADPDDNKFFDAAIAGGADYIITNDKHFNVVKHLSFPPMSILSSDDFLEIIRYL